MHSSTLGRTLALVASAAMLASLTAATVAAPAAAAADDCRVRNLDKGSVRPTLRKAVKWADAGDRLRVRGTCHGTTKIDKDLSITGIRKDGSGKPTLDADGKGTVLTIEKGVTVSLRDLKVTGGKAHQGGGVANWGTLKLRGSTVIRNNQTTWVGPGIYNPGGTLKLFGTSSIRNNTGGPGGGVFNTNSGTVKLYGKSTIRGNRSSGSGGGVYVESDSTLRLYHKSSIQHNSTTDPFGGGVQNWGTLALWGQSSISHNTSGAEGGGVKHYWTSTLINVDCGLLGNVHDNGPDDCHYTGR